MSTSKTTTDVNEKQAAVQALLDAPPSEIHSLESILAKLPEADRKEAMRILYGTLPETLPIPAATKAFADKRNFDVAAYKFHAAAEQRRAARIVRVGVIQK